MTGRYLAQDIRDYVITMLEDSSSGFDAMIGTINTERTHTTPVSNSITYSWGRNQLPLLIVDVDDSEAQYDDDATPLNLQYTLLPELYTLLIAGYMKYANDNVYNYVEDWIEATIRVLHNYNDTNISWITYQKTERADVYKNENEILKSFLVEFEIRIN